MSIRPQWVGKILNGEKTLEIRKTMPKCDLPIDVYIYCTKARPYLTRGVRGNVYPSCVSSQGIVPHHLNGKVVAKFTLNTAEEIKWELPNKLIFQKNMLENACLSGEELYKYLGEKGGYAIHITKLETFDKPMSLNAFYYAREPRKDLGLPKNWKQIVTRPPQSFMFIEV